MTTPTSIEQHLAQPKVREDSPAMLGTTGIIEYRPQRDGPPIERLTELSARRDEKQPSRIAAYFNNTNAIVVGSAVLAGTTLFTIGFLNRPIKHALQHLAESAASIDVPITLPVTIVEAAIELLADRRTIEKTSAKSDEVTGVRLPRERGAK